MMYLNKIVSISLLLTSIVSLTSFTTVNAMTFEEFESLRPDKQIEVIDEIFKLPELEGWKKVNETFKKEYGFTSRKEYRERMDEWNNSKLTLVEKKAEAWDYYYDDKLDDEEFKFILTDNAISVKFGSSFTEGNIKYSYGLGESPEKVADAYDGNRGYLLGATFIGKGAKQSDALKKINKATKIKINGKIFRIVDVGDNDPKNIINDSTFLKSRANNLLVISESKNNNVYGTYYRKIADSGVCKSKSFLEKESNTRTYIGKGENKCGIVNYDDSNSLQKNSKNEIGLTQYEDKFTTILYSVAPKFSKSFTEGDVIYSVEDSNGIPDAVNADLGYLKGATLAPTSGLSASGIDSIDSTITLNGNSYKIVDTGTNAVSTAVPDIAFRDSSATELLVISEQTNGNVNGTFYKKITDENICKSDEFAKRDNTIFKRYVGAGSASCFIATTANAIAIQTN